MNKLLKSVFKYTLYPYDNLDNVLQKIINWIVLIIITIGIPVLIIGILEAIKLKQHDVIVVYCILFFPIAFISIFRKRIHYKISAAIIFIFMFLLASHNITIYGFGGAGIPIFLSLFVLTSIFYGIRIGLFSIFLALIPMAIIAYLMISGKLEVDVDLMHIVTLPISWVTAMSVLFLLGLLIVISYSFIQYNFLEAIRITQEKNKQIQAANNELKLEIERREKIQLELEEAKNRAVESDRLKSAFLANMSHEIRTPMNGIIGFTDVLKRKNLTKEKQNKYLDIIQQSGDRMLNTVNDILEISKIETGLIEPDYEEFIINDRIEFYYEFFQYEALNKGLQLLKNVPKNSEKLTIKVDRMMFDSIFINLIKNAIKFTFKGNIEIGYTIKSNNQADKILFYVSDTGIGIPINKRESIFDRFTQAEIHENLALQGTGLGLSIVKAYVEILDGTIDFVTMENVGTTFHFTF